MTVSVFMMNKTIDFKLFGCEIDSLRIYERHDVVSQYKWRLLFTFLQHPDIKCGRHLDEIVIPTYNNDIVVFTDCKVRSIDKIDGTYTVIVNAESTYATYTYDVTFKDGKQTILIGDGMLVKDAYGDITKFTYEEFKTRLITRKL